MTGRGRTWMLIAALMAVHSPLFASTVQVPVVRLDATAEIEAPPATVWTYMTTGKNLVTWCPYWNSKGNTQVTLGKVGDVLDYTDGWGNGGHSVVTYFDPQKEIRIAHEPTDGSYMCQAKLMLQPSGNGTRVTYVEQYTDESSPDDMKATAAKMQKEMDDALAALKKATEK